VRGAIHVGETFAKRDQGSIVVGRDAQGVPSEGRFREDMKWEAAAGANSP